ncbi:MAG: metallophosphoesterase family protein [Promethearchaeota archaeon]
MKILVLADIHGKYDELSKLLNKIKSNGFDLIICPGDFTDQFDVPNGFSQIDIAEIILQKMLSLKIPVFAVPGNHDPYEILDLFDEYGVNLHNKVKKFKDVYFLGFGGAETPFNTNFEPPEKEVKESLEELKKEIKNKKFVLVTHNPPKNTKLDKVSSGVHVGSEEIKKFISKEQPILAISAHIHEAAGIDEINKTKLFYPGPVFNGCYGIVEINKEIKCEIKKETI